jgi:hypothetical protein
MSSPTELIKKYQDRIVALTKEIDSHPFVYSVGFRFNDASNYNYRLQREQEIDDLKARIKQEKDRDQLLSHNVLNKQLADQGIQTLAEKATPLDNWITFLNKGTPLGIIGNTLVAPIASGVGGFISNPFMPLILLAAGVVVIIIIMKF